jgi:hypothetical protein
VGNFSPAARLLSVSWSLNSEFGLVWTLDEWNGREGKEEVKVAPQPQSTNYMIVGKKGTSGKMFCGKGFIKSHPICGENSG